MPKQRSKEPPLASAATRDPATEECLRRMDARKRGARESELSKLKLSTLLEAIGRLSQIQEIDLSHDQLKTLPEAVQRFERLETPLYHGNPGLGLPNEVLGHRQGNDAEALTALWKISQGAFLRRLLRKRQPLLSHNYSRWLP